MLGKCFSLNGKLIPVSKAVISIDNIEFSYGFAVYENIRLRNNKVYFLAKHLERLMHSAKIIGLVHNFEIDVINEWVDDLIKKNEIDPSAGLGVNSGNIKILLIGGVEPQLYIMLLAPQYPDKKIYRDGVKVTTYNFERFLPQAKTLNMLPSYLAYAEAKKQEAYDALFVDNQGNVVEGTRSNFFVIKNKILYTTPVDKVLDGVTRRTVIDCATKNGYQVEERDIKLTEIFNYDGAFLTNTSGKIVPVKEVESYKVHKVIKFDTICDEIKNLIKLYDDYLDNI